MEHTRQSAHHPRGHCCHTDALWSAYPELTQSRSGADASLQQQRAFWCHPGQSAGAALAMMTSHDDLCLSSVTADSLASHLCRSIQHFTSCKGRLCKRLHVLCAEAQVGYKGVRVGGGGSAMRHSWVNLLNIPDTQKGSLALSQNFSRITAKFRCLVG